MRVQSDRAQANLDLLDHELNGFERGCRQLGQVTSLFRDGHGQPFELHPWRGRGRLQQRDHLTQSSSSYPSLFMIFTFMFTFLITRRLKFL